MTGWQGACADVGRRLRAQVVTVALVALAVAAAGVTAQHLGHDLGYVRARLDEVRTVYGPQVARAAWYLDEGLMRQLVDGMVKLDLVAGARLRLTSGVQYEAGQPGRGRAEAMAVEHLAGDELFRLGTLTVWLDVPAFWQRAALRWLATMVLLAAVTAAGVWCCLLLLRRLVGQPLACLEREATRLAQGQWDVPVVGPGTAANGWSELAMRLEALRQALAQEREGRQHAEEAVAVRDRALDCLPSAVWLLDAAGLVRYANAAARRLTPEMDRALPAMLPASWVPVRALLTAALAEPPASGWMERELVLDGHRAWMGIAACPAGVLVAVHRYDAEATL